MSKRKDKRDGNNTNDVDSMNHGDDDNIASLFERFIDDIGALPAEIVKSLELMRELDDRCNSIVDDVRQRIEDPAEWRRQRRKRRRRSRDTSGSGDGDDDDEEEDVTQEFIDTKFREAQLLSEEKVALSSRCYEEVDRCIRKLDEQLALFAKAMGQHDEQVQEELAQHQLPNTHLIRTLHQNHRAVLHAIMDGTKQHQHQQAVSGPQSDAVPAASGAGITGSVAQNYMLNHLDNNHHRHTGAPLSLSTSAAALAASAGVHPLIPPHQRTGSLIGQQQLGPQDQLAHRRKLTPAVTGTEQHVAMGPAATPTSGIIDSDMPVDPNEPVYCICQRVSFGSMVACDNETCPYEWFHFPCVGLVESPKGKWYCPHCRDQKPTQTINRSRRT